MKKIKTHIDGLFVIKNKYLTDIRGGFLESWNNIDFKKENLIANFSQDNISISKKNVIRGLHFQSKPYGQIKYVRVLKGKVLDVVVDIRENSKTFGEYFKIELSEKNHHGLWIPAGFAHGFLSLEEESVFAYKCAGNYNPKYEHTIKWNDPDIGIKWNTKNPIISKKDQEGMSFNKYKASNLKSI